MKATSIEKNLLLDQLEHSVERHLQEAVANFQNLSPEILLMPSSSGGWSIAQCLDHLNSYGNYYLPKIKNELDKPSIKGSDEVFTSSWLGNYFTKIMHPQTGKKKYKAFKNYTPSVKLDAHAVVAQFIEQQETLLSYLKKSRHTDLNRIKIPLSIFEWVTFKLGDAFQFLVAHNERHVLQAKRNLVQKIEIN